MGLMARELPNYLMLEFASKLEFRKSLIGSKLLYLKSK